MTSTGRWVAYGNLESWNKYCEQCMALYALVSSGCYMTTSRVDGGVAISPSLLPEPKERDEASEEVRVEVEVTVPPFTGWLNSDTYLKQPRLLRRQKAQRQGGKHGYEYYTLARS
jgi:hypothetical protein